MNLILSLVLFLCVVMISLLLQDLLCTGARFFPKQSIFVRKMSLVSDQLRQYTTSLEFLPWDCFYRFKQISNFLDIGNILSLISFTVNQMLRSKTLSVENVIFFRSSSAKPVCTKFSLQSHIKAWSVLTLEKDSYLKQRILTQDSLLLSTDFQEKVEIRGTSFVIFTFTEILI